jgi:hypothetical protein
MLLPALLAISFNLDSTQLQITGEYKLQIEVHTNYGIVHLAPYRIKSHFQDKLLNCENLTMPT